MYTSNLKNLSRRPYFEVIRSLNFNLTFKKIGMRNIKTALAVTLSIAASKAMKMDYAFFAAIAAIICLESSVFESINAARNRMIGTIVGALVGLIGALISPNNLLVPFFGIVAVIYLLNILNGKKSVVIGCIVFCSIMVNLNGANPFHYSIDRILDTILGVSIAALVNYLITPPDLVKTAVKECSKIKSIIQSAIQLDFNFNKTNNFDELSKHITALENLLQKCMLESNLRKNNESEINRIKHFLTYSKEILMHMQAAAAIKDNIYFLDTENEIKDHTLNERKKLEIVYSYHLNELSINVNKLSIIQYIIF